MAEEPRAGVESPTQPGPVEQFGVLATLSRWRPRVQIPSGPPSLSAPRYAPVLVQLFTTSPDPHRGPGFRRGGEGRGETDTEAGVLPCQPGSRQARTCVTGVTELDCALDSFDPVETPANLICAIAPGVGDISRPLRNRPRNAKRSRRTRRSPARSKPSGPEWGLRGLGCAVLLRPRHAAAGCPPTVRAPPLRDSGGAHQACG